MNKLAIIPVFFLTMCGTAPVTPPAGAFELEIDRDHWLKVYDAIEYIKQEKVKETRTSPEDAINKALMEFENGSNGSTKQKELLQLSSNRDQ